MPGTIGTSALSASSRAAVLSPSSSSSSALGPTKVMPALSQARGERRVFRKKSVAGMNQVDALFLCQRDDSFHIQIRLDRTFSFPDLVCLIRLEAMEAEPVLLRVDGYGAQAHFRGGAHNTDRDFTAVESKKLRHLFRVCHALLKTRRSAITELRARLPARGWQRSRRSV